jgi:hypothetical protein
MNTDMSVSIPYTVWMHGARYKYVKAKNHPLAPPSGMLPEHRFVLYAELGPGPQKCHWCGKTIYWEIPPSRDGCIDTDHLDDDRHNNAPENLVPSCHRCNIIRTHNRRFTEKLHVISSSAGTRRTAVERVCQRPGCGKKFLKEKALIDRDPEKFGKYCSRECAWNRNKPVE